jgi:hypothetical protein
MSKSITTIKVTKRPVKALGFAGEVGKKTSPKGNPAAGPSKISRKHSLSKFPEPADSHTKEHQSSNYLAYEVKAGAGVRAKGK